MGVEMSVVVEGSSVRRAPAQGAMLTVLLSAMFMAQFEVKRSS
jgi:hypothetical protein